MGNFIENTLEGIGNAAKGLFGGSDSSRPSNAQQIQAIAARKAAADSAGKPVEGNLTEAQMDDLRARSMMDYRSVPGTSGGVPGTDANTEAQMDDLRARTMRDPRSSPGANGGVPGMKKGGKVKAYAKGGMVSSASSRGDGIAQRGKTKGRMC